MNKNTFQILQDIITVFFLFCFLFSIFIKSLTIGIL
jgi:hypothetical protein